MDPMKKRKWDNPQPTQTGGAPAAGGSGLQINPAMIAQAQAAALMAAQQLTAVRAARNSFLNSNGLFSAALCGRGDRKPSIRLPSAAAALLSQLPTG